VPRYRWSVTVPPGTPEAQAVENTIEVDEQRIQDGLIFAARGSAGSVKAALLLGERQILPVQGSDRTVIPGTTDAAPLSVVTSGSPYTVRLRAFAPTSAQPHTVIARIDTKEVGTADQAVRVTELPRSGIRRGPSTDVTPQDLQPSTEDS
jgi:hypothetical protein